MYWYIGIASYLLVGAALAFTAIRANWKCEIGDDGVHGPYRINTNDVLGFCLIMALWAPAIDIIISEISWARDLHTTHKRLMRRSTATAPNAFIREART